MPSQVFYSKRHDTGSSPQPIFTPPPDTPWDLTEEGITLTFITRLPTTETPKVRAACTAVGPWTVRYDPIATDVDTIGAYDVEVEVVRANGKKITLPTRGYLSWVIEPDLDNQ